MYTELISKLNPKPLFNLNWYNGEDLYSEGDIEDITLKIIADNEPEDYTEAISANFCWPTFYHLTHTRKNILNWYPFKKDGHVLEIGCGFGSITNMLCDKCEHVTAVELSKRRATGTLLRCREKENLEIIVGNLNDIEFSEKYDYITLIGVLEYQGNYTNTVNPYLDFLKKIKSLLKPNGKLLIAIENQYGLKYWCGAFEDHTSIPFDGINQYKISNQKVKTFSKQALNDLVIASGFSNTFFYYPMPDYKLPTVIFSDSFVPQTEALENPMYYYIPNASTMIASEADLYKDIVANNVFPFFANSFLVECGNCEDLGQISFAKLNSLRCKEYRTGTKLESGDKVVKFSLEGNHAVAHIHQIVANEQRLFSNGLDINLSHINENELIQSYVHAPLLDMLLVEAHQQLDSSKIYHLFDSIWEDINKSSLEIEWTDNVIYEYGLDVPTDPNKYGRILQYVPIDMIPRNAFWVDDHLMWIDQEWMLENIPASFAMYRCINEFYCAYPHLLNCCIPITDIATRYKLINVWDIFSNFEKHFISVTIDQHCINQNAHFQNFTPATIVENIQNLINR